MKMIETVPNIDISEWTLAASEDFGKAFETAVLKAAGEALSACLEKENAEYTYLYFPAEWLDTGSDGIGGAPVTDALDLYLRIGLGSDIESPTFKFNLRGALSSALEDAGRNKGNSKGLEQIAIELRRLADEIYAVLN